MLVEKAIIRLHLAENDENMPKPSWKTSCKVINDEH